MGEVVAGALGKAAGGRSPSTRARSHRRAPPRQRSASRRIRGGDIVGDHTVLFAGAGERIEITHRSTAARICEGSLRAARFVRQAAAGLFGMDDVLGLAAR